ncbi:MAG: hypothetical protein PVH03_03180 [Chloroflexota bacterium]|jgi:hypothetical protein
MKIEFSNDQEAELVIVGKGEEVGQAVQALGLAGSRPVLVLVGGASGVTDEQQAIISQAIEVVAKVIETTGAAVVDGGTDSGVMAAIGQARYKGQYDFPLVGVAVKNLVNWPGQPADRPAGEDRFPLEAHHSHFVLVPGQNWGDESKSLADVGTAIAATHPSLTILLNGGNIAKQDIAHSLEAGRPVLVLSGTGRYADELATDPPESELIQIVPASDYEVVTSRVYGTLLGNS